VDETMVGWNERIGPNGFEFILPRRALLFLLVCWFKLSRYRKRQFGSTECRGEYGRITHPIPSLRWINRFLLESRSSPQLSGQCLQTSYPRYCARSRAASPDQDNVGSLYISDDIMHLIQLARVDHITISGDDRSREVALQPSDYVLSVKDATHKN
jgi:hypothetical protein